MYTYIYGLQDPTNGKIRYVGKSNTPKNRYYQHINQAHQCRTHKECWIHGLIQKGFKPKLVIIEKVLKEDWQSRERFYIKKYSNLTNLTKGGDGTDGWKPSLETKEKMSIAHRGERNGFYGKTHSKQTRKYLSELNKGKGAGKDNPFYGKKHSKETRNKLSKLAKQRIKDGTLPANPPVLWGKDNPSSKARIVISPNGERFTVYSLKPFCLEHNISYRKLLRFQNNGPAPAPTDHKDIIRQREKSKNTIGWELIFRSHEPNL